MDAYQTIDPRAVEILAPHLQGVETFAEPCAGEGRLVAQLEGIGLKCEWYSDLTEGVDALDTFMPPVGAIITNPPWTRDILHRMIVHFQRQAPTWLLFDADWAHTKQAAPYLPQCSNIVAVGRLKWIEGSPHCGKDNVAWYRFHSQHVDGPKFIGHKLEAA
jgi:hypothetical protein